VSERPRRKLAAVIAADVAGYSRLVREDEEGALGALRGHRTELIDPLLTKYGGRIANTAGDSLLLEFPSVVDAVRCGVAMQKGLAERNKDIAEERRIQFRVGVNIGDVVVDGDDLLGDGVNVEVEVKNIDRPIQIWRWHSGARPAAPEATLAGERARQPDRAAIAVLPFSNVSGDAEQEYFADGITEDIITALTYWRSFPVIARNSCFAYKDTAVDIKEAARALGARYLLEGSVRRSGQRVRVTAQLIDGADGRHVWAERHDRDLVDIFEVQDDLVQRIAAVVAPELAKAELKHARGKRADDLDAWDLCLRAMPLLRERTRDGNAKARALFLRAIALRPDYSDAYAGLAMSYHQDILIGVAADQVAAATKAMEAARKAVECDEASSWAHHELSTAYQWLERPDDALDEARVSVELNPYDAYALHALGNKSDLSGDPQGIEFMEKAQRLNPEDARQHTHLTFLARAYVNAGNHDAAVDKTRQALRRRPDYAPAYYILAIALAYLGRLEEARAALAKCDEVSPGFVESRSDWRPYVDAASNERLREGLRRAEAQA
jgi:adenylate cyclase